MFRFSRNISVNNKTNGEFPTPKEAKSDESTKLDVPSSLSKDNGMSDGKSDGKSDGNDEGDKESPIVLTGGALTGIVLTGSGLTGSVKSDSRVNNGKLSITQPTDQRGKLIRYDENTSFSCRSELCRSCPDAAPSQEEMALRKVTFNENAVVHLFQTLTDSEVAAYFMNQEDFERSDADIDSTLNHWVIFQNGRGTFNEDEITIRGLEPLIANNDMRATIMRKHSQDVVLESKLQKYQGKECYDWDKIKTVAEKTSRLSVVVATKMGAKDASDAAAPAAKSRRAFSVVMDVFKVFGRTKRTGGK